MSDAMEGPVVIVGAGHAAGELATSLRLEGYAGRIIMVGDELHLPYQRPPLSKAYLSGDIEAAALYLKPQATYDKAKIDFFGGRRVRSISRSLRTVTLDDGAVINYGTLVLATGGRPRRLVVPGAAEAERAENFHYLRTLDDVSRIRQQIVAGKRLVIIGGGYVGLEVAAVAIKRGLHVTVLEGASRVLARVTAPQVSAFYEQVHRSAGVDIRTAVSVEGIEIGCDAGYVTAVLCSNGSRVEADLVVVGVGLMPNVELAEESGLVVDNGIVVDEFARTSDPHIFAAGDCTNHPNSLLGGRRIRLESVPNALEQARTVAATLCGKHRPYASMPWFWSDQYDLKLQMVGLSEGYDNVVIRGDPIDRSFIAFYLRGGVVIAADAVGRPQEFMLCKRVVTERLRVEPGQLSDQSLPLKTILAAQAV